MTRLNVNAEQLGRFFSGSIILYVILIIILILIPPTILIVLSIRKSKRIIKQHQLNTMDDRQASDYSKNSFYTLTQEEKQKLEKSKKRITISFILSIVPIILIISIKIISTINPEFKNAITTAIAILLIIIDVVSIYAKVKLEKDYKRIFFEIYTPRLLDSVNKDINSKQILNNSDMVDILSAANIIIPRSQYSDSYKESKNDYDNALFYTKKYLYYRSQDLINIVYENNDIKIRNVTTEIYSILSKRKTEELFKGLFACAKCNFNLGNYINISTEQVINKPTSSEKYKFIVSNQSNADNYDLLSYELLELIHNFYLNAGINFEITYSNNNIYFRFFTGNNLSPSIKSDSIDNDILYKYYLILKFIIEFIETNKRV